MLRALVVLILLALVLPAFAHVHDAVLSQYAQQWLNKQRIPGGAGKGTSCCSQADASLVEEDIRYGGDGIGRYWVRCPTAGTCPLRDWTLVPDEAVIREANRAGRPVVWWYYLNGVPKVRCFAPGAGI